MSIDNVNNVLSIQKVTNYNTYLEDVVGWNKTCESAPPVLFKQWRLVEEEAQELYEAFDKGDVKEFFKELCDLFVVSSYAAYIVDDQIEAHTQYQDDIEYLLGQLTALIENRSVVAVYHKVLELMNSVNQLGLHRTMEATLRSNWSKIFPEDEAEEELHFAKIAYAGRYEGIYVQRKPEGCVLKDKHNKVLKPSSYKHYEEYL